MTSFTHQTLALHQEAVATPDNFGEIPMPIPIGTGFLAMASMGSLDRLISNPLVRGYSNLSVQSDEGAHFVPYGRGHAEVVANSPHGINYETSMESSQPNPAETEIVQSKTIPNPNEIVLTASAILEAIDAEGCSDLDTASEPQPNDITTMANQEGNQGMTKLEKTKRRLSLLLKEWKLGQYIDVLINEMGYDDMEDWKDVTTHELEDEMKFKPGHAKRFKRKTKEHFENKE